MPRNVDPNTIGVGAGRVSNGTVEDSSLRYPERDTDPLRVHIHDPVRAHMASTIGIVDAAGCYTSDEVEGALEEICTGAGAGRLNGLIAGGTFVEAIPGGDLTLTLVAGTTILINAHTFDAGGLTVTLPDAAVDYFIYFDTLSSSGTYETLQFTVGTPPEVETTLGVEQVMIAKVSCDGAGNTTVYQDARFFVRNLDRKVQYSSRQGEDVDAWSEGCFATLDAAMFWMQYYSPNLAGEEQKGTILVRGKHTLSDTLTIPTSGIIFQGGAPADAAQIALSANTGRTLIDLNGNNSIHFKNIEFISETPHSNTNIAIRSSAGADDIVFDQCKWSSSAGNTVWQSCVMLTGGSTQEGLLVKDCDFADAFNGITIDAPVKSVIEGSNFTPGTAVAASPATVHAIIFLMSGDSPAEFNSIKSCTFDRWMTGILSQGFFHRSVIESCQFKDCGTGPAYNGADHPVIYLNDSGGAKPSSHIDIVNCYMNLNADALKGIWLKGSDHKVSQCALIGGYVIASPPAVNEVPIGIHAEGSLITINGCQISNFFNPNYDGGNNSIGWGVYVGDNSNPTSEVKVSDCLMSGGGVMLSQRSNSCSVSDNTIKGQPGSAVSHYPLVFISPESHGISVTSNTLDCAENSVAGVRMLGGDGIWSYNIVVDSNIIVATHKAASGTLDGIGASIQVVGRIRHWTITNNNIDNWHNTGDQEAVGIEILGQGSLVPQIGVISGNSIVNGISGILCIGTGTPGSDFVQDIEITSNTVSFCAQSVTMDGNDVVDPTTTANVWSYLGCKGIGLNNSTRITVVGNKIGNLGVWQRMSDSTLVLPPNNSQAFGIFARNSPAVEISSNKVSGIFANSLDVPNHYIASYPIRVDAVNAMLGGGKFSVSDVNIIGNMVKGTGAAPAQGTANCGGGIVVVAGGPFPGSINNDPACAYEVSKCKIADNVVSNVASDVTNSGAFVPAGIRFVNGSQGNCTQIQIDDNIIEGIRGFGVYLWNGQNNIAATPYLADISQWSVSNNNISAITCQDTGVGPLAGGPAVRVLQGPSCNYDGGKVSGNIIGICEEAAIYFTGGQATINAESRTTRTEINNNTIDLVTFYNSSIGIWFDTSVVGSASAQYSEFRGISIDGNTIGNNVLATESTVRGGILYAHSEQDIINLSIQNNNIVCGGGTQSQGISLVTADNSTQTIGADIKVCGNSVTSYQNGGGTVDGIKVNLEAIELSQVNVDGNTTTNVNPAPTTEHGITLHVDNSQLAETHKQISVSGNNCKVSSGSSNATLWVTFNAVADGTMASLSGLSINNNFVGGGGAMNAGNIGALHLEFSGGAGSAVNELSGVSIDGNKCLLGANGLGIMTQVGGTTNASFVLSGLKITNNQILGDGTGRGVYSLFNASTATYDTSGVVIDSNFVESVNAPIELLVNNTCARLENWSVSRNEIKNYGLTTVANAIDITTYERSQAGSVSGNLIQDGDIDADTHAIVFENMGQTTTANLAVCDNRVNNIGGAGVGVSLGSAFAAFANSNIDRSIVIDDNSFTGTNKNSPSEAVVNVERSATNPTPDSMAGVSVCGNTMMYCGQADSPQTAGTTTDCIIVNGDEWRSCTGLEVSNNQIVGGPIGGVVQVFYPYRGIVVVAPNGGGSGLVSTSIRDNIIHDCYMRSIQVTHEDALDGLDISGNLCKGDVDDSHIYLGSTDRGFDNVSINNNNLRSLSVLAGTRSHIELNQSSATATRLWRNVSVSNNLSEGCNSGQAYDYGSTVNQAAIRVLPQNTSLKNFRCDGNIIRIPGSRGIDIDDKGNDGFAVNHYNVSVSDNQISQNGNATVGLWDGIRILLMHDAPSATTDQCGWINTRVCGNQVHVTDANITEVNSGYRAISLWAGADAASPVGDNYHLFRQTTISDNHVRNHRYAGIGVYVGEDSNGADPGEMLVNLQQLSVHDNIVRTLDDGNDPSYAVGGGGCFFFGFRGQSADNSLCVFDTNTSYLADQTGSTHHGMIWLMSQRPNSWVVSNNAVRGFNTNDGISANVAIAFDADSGVCHDNIMTDCPAGTGFLTTPWTNMNDHNNYNT